MTLGWMVVVLLVGGSTFAVVSHAGSRVGEASALRSAAAVVPSSSSATGSTTRPTSATPAPTRSATPSASPSPSAGPGSPRPPATSRPRTSTPAPPPTPRRTATTSTPATRTASFTTAGGTVTASCTGTTIRRQSITPRDGWRFEEDLSSRKLEVHFSRSGHAPEGVATDDSEDEVEVTITCVGGEPTRESH